MSTVHDAIGGALSGFGGHLRCETCGHKRQLGNIGRKLATGWPKCCGYTMRWWTQRQIDAAVPALSPTSETKRA